MADFSAMNRAIINYVNSRLPKDKNRTVKGILSGDNVIIGNKKYYADMVSDMYYRNGDEVYCLLPESGYKVAVVGK